MNELIRCCFERRGVYAYVAPFYGQAKKVIWDSPDMLAKYCPPFVWNKRNKSELKLTFPNDSILYVLGADNPDSMRGMDLKGVIFDEYADMKEDVWTVAKPMLAGNRGWAWFGGTPKGYNDFKSRLDYAMTSGDPDWWGMTLKASTSGIIDAESLAEARRTMPQALYDQEFEVKFLDSAGQFFRRILENVKGTGFEPSHRFKLGGDLAKYQDWTVFTAIDLCNFGVLPQERFNHIDWNLQKARAEAFYYKYGKGKFTIDSTGVGDPIVEDLGKKLQGVNGFKFTEDSRRELLTNLALLLEQDKIKVPNDEGLISELQSFRFELGERGRTKITVPDGCTDDRVMSLALACWGLPDRPLTSSRPSTGGKAFDPYSIF